VNELSLEMGATEIRYIVYTSLVATMVRHVERKAISVIPLN
jgi:hypothetical protein